MTGLAIRNLIVAEIKILGKRLKLLRAWYPDVARSVRWDATSFGAAFVLIIAIVLGGASRQHELRLAIVQLAALPVLAFALTKFVTVQPSVVSRLAKVVIVSVLGLPLLQLIPLPPGIWLTLPGRGELGLALQLANVEAGWTPLSLTPEKTWRSALALIPPLAMFLAIILCDNNQRSRLIATLMFCVAISMVVGAAQLVSGSETFYPWRTTAAGNIVGFFANRNHFATAALMVLPFVVVMGSTSPRETPQKNRARLGLSIMFVALIIAAVAATQSRAGVIILPFALAGSLAAAWVASGRRWPSTPLVIAVGAVAMALLTVTVFAIDPVMDRFETGATLDKRMTNWPIILEAANAYLPAGSGIGSFDAVFRSVEPLEQLGPTFFNQAHNDYLETWLEAGWFGAAVLALFLVWFSRRSWAAWVSGPTSASNFPRAASIAVAVVMGHSLFDYPLRTEAIAVMFALCCGLLEAAHRLNRQVIRRRGSEVRFVPE